MHAYVYESFLTNANIREIRWLPIRYTGIGWSKQYKYVCLTIACLYRSLYPMVCGTAWEVTNNMRIREQKKYVVQKNGCPRWVLKNWLSFEGWDEDDEEKERTKIVLGSNSLFLYLNYLIYNLIINKLFDAEVN